jgi:hypothetical protein
MKHAQEGWSKLKDFEKQVTRLLLIFEHLTDLEAIRKLNQQGMAMSHARVFLMIAENTGFLYEVDPLSHYTTDDPGRWAIKPSIKETLKQIAEGEQE